MTDTKTVCRTCGTEIKAGQLILDPDFTFETGVHTLDDCILTDSDELRELDAAILLEQQG